MFSMAFKDVQILFKALNLWDTHPAGRVGEIIDQAVKRRRKPLGATLRMSYTDIA